MSEIAASTDAAGMRRSTGFLPFLMVGFLISLAVPAVFFLGPIRLSPYRVILIVAVVPTLIYWLSGRAGPRHAIDILFILSFLWAFLGMFVHYGGRGLESGAILLIESMGAYFLARTAIRTPGDYRRMVGLHVLILLVLAPFAIFETMTGRPLIIEIVSRVTATVSIITDPRRLGLERVQGTFEHSILYGVFCASAMAGMHYVFNRGRSLMLVIPGYVLVFGSTFVSLSSGAMMALIVQVIVMVWDRLSRSVPRRWSIFGWGWVGIYVALDILSDRTPFHVITSYLTFNSGSGYNRILIWRYGTQNVADHPLFGIGLFGEWERPHWMGDSVDNFWLLMAMRHGLPMALALGVAVFLIFRRLSWVDLRLPPARAARAAYLTALGGLLLASGTVHFWNTMYVWFIFLLGSGIFLLDYDEEPGGAAAAEDGTATRRRPGYSRGKPTPRPPSRAGRAAATRKIERKYLR